MKQKYRMIAIDLDGTLLSPSSEVTPRVKQAVHRVLESGLLVCFATGRNWTESREVLDAIEHYPTAVFAGGAMVVDTHKQVLLHQTKMDTQLATELCRILEGYGHAVLALQDSNGSGIDYLISDLPLNDATSRWLANTESIVHHVPRLGDCSHDRTVRVGIVAAPEQTSRIARELEQRFGERILTHRLPVPSQPFEILEIFDPAVNKWEGILHIARRHDIEPREIIAIGDEVNDIPMIRKAGLGVAMGNARPPVRDAADLVIGGNHEEGLAIFLEKLIEDHLVEALDEDSEQAEQRAGMDRGR
jgi:Cof subfamily protein (haloacid dehalogenase superfamily)